MDYFRDQKLYVQNAGSPWSYSTNSSGVSRFEVRAGDHWATDGSAPKERSEIAATQKLAFGEAYSVSFSMMIEPGAKNTADWMTLAQIQSNFDKGEAGHSPAFAIEMVGEKMRIVSRDSPVFLSSDANTQTQRLYTDTADIVRGHWYNFNLTVKLDAFGDGVLQVTRDGKQLVNYEGAFGFNDAVGSYLKIGVYRETSLETFAVDYKPLTVIKTALSAAPSDDQGLGLDPHANYADALSQIMEQSNTLFGDGRANTLSGGAGEDLLRGGLGKDILRGGAGSDTADFSDKSAWLRVDLHLDNAGSVAVGGVVEDTLYSIENVIGGSASDVITGDAAANQLFGGMGGDQLKGMDGADLLDGGMGHDLLYGGAGDDILLGGADNDTLDGGGGADVLFGGANNDVFRFTATTDSLPQAMDRIADYAQGDRIDLSAIDANIYLAGDQAFMAVSAFTGTAGQLTMTYGAGVTTVLGDVNGDGVADFGFRMDGHAPSSTGWLF